MKRELRAIGLIMCITALIAVAYIGIAHLIEEHVASETVSLTVFPKGLVASH